MPVYEYRCADCASTFEKLVPMSANGAPSECPDCGGRSDKLLSMFAAHGSERPGAGGGGGCCGGGGGGCACAAR